MSQGHCLTFLICTLVLQSVVSGGGLTGAFGPSDKTNEGFTGAFGPSDKTNEGLTGAFGPSDKTNEGFTGPFGPSDLQNDKTNEGFTGAGGPADLQRNQDQFEEATLHNLFRKTWKTLYEPKDVQELRDVFESTFAESFTVTLALDGTEFTREEALTLMEIFVIDFESKSVVTQVGTVTWGDTPENRHKTASFAYIGRVISRPPIKTDHEEYDTDMNAVVTWIRDADDNWICSSSTTYIGAQEANGNSFKYFLSEHFLRATIHMKQQYPGYNIITVAAGSTVLGGIGIAGVVYWIVKKRRKYENVATVVDC